MKNKTFLQGPILLLMGLLLFRAELSAQISVTFFQKNRYEFHVNECNDFTLINASSPETVDVEYELTGKNGQLTKGVWKDLRVAAGSNNYKNNTPAITYSSEATAIGLNLTQKLKPGEYQLCYWVLKSGTREELASPCFDVQVLSISPPLLIFPSQGSTVNTLNPNLVWQGPLLAGGRSSGFLYDLKLAELLPGQEPYDALNQNFAMFKAEGISVQQMVYPFQASRLSNGKSYAWQVIARNNAGYVAETEIWTFTVQLDTFQKPDVVFFEGFLIPSKTENEGILNIRNALKLSFSESYPLTLLEFSMLNERKQPVGSIDSSLVQSVDYNKFVVPLEKLSFPLRNKQVYYLQIRNANTAETYLVKFKYFNR